MSGLDEGPAARKCAVDEAQFGQRFAAPVKPGVESRAPRDLRRPRLGDEHAVGLNRAVDPGAATEDRGPRGPEPRRVALGKRFGAIATEFHEALRAAHVLSGSGVGMRTQGAREPPWLTSRVV